MANFSYAGTIGGVSPEERTFNVVAGTTASIAIGDPVVIANGYAAAISNGGGVSTGTALYGLAVSASDETASAAGTVKVIFSPAGLIVNGVATTPANLAAAVLFDSVTLDVSGAVITVDENDTSSGGILIYDFIGTDYATTGKCKVILPFKLI